MATRLRSFLLVLFWSSAGLAADPETILQQIHATRLDPSQAAEVRNVKLLLGGGGTLMLRGGLVVPATPVGTAPVELVFVGDGTIQLDAPDEIEGTQLELFTGATKLSEDFDEGVFVLAEETAVRALLQRRSPGPSPDQLARAADLYQKWIDSPERKQMSIEAVLFADGLNDPSRRGYCAASIHGRELGTFLYIYDPDDSEELTLGQFVPLSVEKREERRIRKKLEREQRRGKGLGVRLEDLGQWDTWMSFSGGPKAKASSVPDFEPERYVLEIDVADRSLHVSGKARIDLTARSGRRQIIQLQLHPDLTVQRVLAGTAAVPYFRSGSDLYIHLPSPPADNETVSVTVEYSGEILEKAPSKAIVLRDALGWYPRAGLLDRALYDVTFRWPRSLTLVSSGKRVDGGVTGERQWERRTLDQPSFSWSFELGHFVRETFDVGHIRVTLAWDPEGRSLDNQARDEIRQTVRDALLYFEETYGRYPLDELTVSTVMRDFSQSHFGFITLSNLMMADFSEWATVLGIEDRRTVIAHEIAHQWWGHVVGWRSYRDQWFTEALANYSALRFARKRLPGGGRSRIGPISGWQGDVLDLTEDGRTLESLGPLTLGVRLSSSRSDRAYETIVYKKGTLVFSMLARNYGEDVFDQILRAVVTVAANRQISTEDLLRIVHAAVPEVDVDEFAKQFIFGTGFPVIRFDYEFSPKGTSAWAVKGSATQSRPARHRYRIVPVESRWAVASELIPESKIEQWSMVVPFQLGIDKPRPLAETRNLSQSQKSQEEEIGNAYIYGRLKIHGETTPFTFDVQDPPRTFWLDRDKETLALFYSPRTSPKRALVSEARSLAENRRFQEAEQKYREVWQAPRTTTFDPEAAREGDTMRKALLQAEDEIADALAHLGIGRILLEQKQYASVRPALQEARKVTRRSKAIDGEIGILEGRLLLEEGDYANSFKRLRGLLLGRSPATSDAEGFAWLAIAAKLTGHPKELEKALEAARRKGVDTAALEP